MLSLAALLIDTGTSIFYRAGHLVGRRPEITGRHTSGLNCTTLNCRQVGATTSPPDCSDAIGLAISEAREISQRPS